MTGPLCASIATILWAASVPVLTRGLRPAGRHGLPFVVSGLHASLCSGTIALFLILIISQRPLPPVTPWLVLAGTLTFPIGTGLYYLCGYGFQKRMEPAAQFSKVKPLLSILLATFFLRESLTSAKILSSCLILGGVAILIWHALRQTIGPGAIFLGLLMALSWTLGEGAMAIALTSAEPLPATFIGLLVGYLLFLGGLLGFKPHWIPIVWRKRHDTWPFLVHGLASFGLAYLFFFAAIQLQGMGRTVLMVAPWPFLGLLLSALIDWLQKRPTQLSPQLIAAGLLLLAGSIITLQS